MKEGTSAVLLQSALDKKWWADSMECYCYLRNIAGGKRVCGGFQDQYAYGQKERTQLCRIGDHEDVEESYDGDDGQRRGANKRRR